MQFVAYGAQDVDLLDLPEVKRTFKINSSTGGKLSVKINKKHNTLKIKMNTDVKIWDTMPVKKYGYDSTTKKTTVKKMIKALEMGRQQVEADRLYDQEIAATMERSCPILHVMADGKNYFFYFDQVQRINHNTLKIKLSPREQLNQIDIGNVVTEVSIITTSSIRTLRERSAHLALPLEDGKYIVKINRLTHEEYNGAASVESKRNKTGNIIAKTIDAAYIYLDSEERIHFAQASHEYLIEQLQFSTNKVSMKSELNVTGKCLTMSNNHFESGTWEHNGDKINIKSASVRDIFEEKQAYQQYVQFYGELEKSKDGFTITHCKKNLTTGLMEKVQVATYEKISQGVIGPFPPINPPMNQPLPFLTICPM